MGVPFSKKGFTLIELLLVMAIMSILAAAVLVSLSGQRTRAQASRAVAEFSAVLQPMMMCLSDGGTVTPPDANGGDAICSLANYGTWPSVGAGALSTIGNYSAAAQANFNNGTWYYSANTTDGSTEICCNYRANRCALAPATIDCSTNNLSAY